jgi:hypothetical protein
MYRTEICLATRHLLVCNLVQTPEPIDWSGSGPHTPEPATLWLPWPAAQPSSLAGFLPVRAQSSTVLRTGAGGAVPASG